MFKAEKMYITCDINRMISSRTQNLLWEKIQDIQCKKDYIQIFKLMQLTYNDKAVILIDHYQEKPMINNIYVIADAFLQDINELEILVLDSGEYSTMMLTKEY